VCGVREHQRAAMLVGDLKFRIAPEKAEFARSSFAGSGWRNR
jgi:hypothetical protein